MKARTPSYQRHRFFAEVPGHATWLFHRFGPSFRRGEELLAARGIAVARETIGQWRQRFVKITRAGSKNIKAT